MRATGNLLDLVNDWLDAFNSGDWLRFEGYFAPDIRFYFRNHGDNIFDGAERVIGSYRGWRALFYDLHGDVSDGFACGERAAAQIVWSGTSVQARPVRFNATFLFTVKAGRFTTIVDFYDRHTYDAQMSPG